jgi:hypothetical protein
MLYGISLFSDTFVSSRMGGLMASVLSIAHVAGRCCCLFFLLSVLLVICSSCCLVCCKFSCLLILFVEKAERNLVYSFSMACAYAFTL